MGEVAQIRGGLPTLPKVGEVVSAEQLGRIERGIILALPDIERIEVADEWRRRAKGIEGYLRSPEMQRPMLGAQRRIEARIGQLLGPARFHHDESSLNPLIPHEADRHAFRYLARALNGECEITDSEWQKSRRALVSLVRLRLDELPVTRPLPEGKYSCIVADPPWQLDTGPDVFGGTGESGHDALSYEQMSVQRITELEVLDRAADDAHLYLWTTNKYLEASYGIARAWGFKPSVLLTWCKKQRGVGLGDTYKLTTEFVLFCRRGSLQHIQTIPTTWFEWPRGKHSQKPDAFYEMVESVTVGPRLDMFARKARNGWIVWGDEV